LALGDQLADSVAALCAEAPLRFTVESGDDFANRASSNVRELVTGLGFEIGASLTSLRFEDAQTLCALREPPLESGDSVIRLVRRPSFPIHGRAYVVRIQSEGRATEVVAKVLALCRYDSLLTNSPRAWDGRDTVILLPDLTSPGAIEFESHRRVPRTLFRETLAFLEQKQIWSSSGGIGPPDGHPAFVEVQLGDRYKVVHLPTILTFDTGFFNLIRESGLVEAACPSEKPGAEVDLDWLVDDPWRIPEREPAG